MFVLDKKKKDNRQNQIFNKTTTKNKHLNLDRKKLFLVALSVLAILAAIFFIQPAITGYNIYSEIQESDLTINDYGKNIKTLEFNLETAKNNITITDQFRQKTKEEFNQISDELTLCLTKASKLEADLQFEKESKKNNLQILQEKLDWKTQQFDDLEKETNEDFNLKLEQTTSTLEQQRDECQANLTTNNNQVEDLENQYEQIIKNSARSICCRQRVDNPNIDSYKLENNKIICSSNADKLLEC